MSRSVSPVTVYALRGPVFVVMGATSGGIGLMAWANVPYVATTSAAGDHHEDALELARQHDFRVELVTEFVRP